MDNTQFERYNDICLVLDILKGTLMSFFKSNTFVTGLALFAMFFGAGNVVFPLLIGQAAGEQNFYAIMGLLITAIGLPILALAAMSAYQGDHRAFFHRLGRIPGSFMILLGLLLIGPIFAIPRTITLAFATFDYAVMNVSLWKFSFVSCLLVFALTVKKNHLVRIVGYVLTPTLLFFLIFIIVKGVMGPSAPQPTDYTNFQIFLQGLFEGYYTMDVFGGLFFSAVIIMSIRQAMPETHKDNTHYVLRVAIKAGLIGGVLLAIIYAGMSYVSAAHGANIDSGIMPAELLAAISLDVLGPYAGQVAAIVTALACLTTAIALTSVFASMVQEYLQTRVQKYPVFRHLRYTPLLVITLAVTFISSLLGFAGIMVILVPILIICYPVFVVLCVCNLAHKLWGIKAVKIPVAATFLLSLALQWQVIAGMLP